MPANTGNDRLLKLHRFGRTQCPDAEQGNPIWMHGFVTAWQYAYARMSPSQRAELDGMIDVALALATK